MALHRVRPPARARSFCACLRPLGILLLVLAACAAPLCAAHAATSAPQLREITVYVYHRPPFFTATPDSQGGPLVEMTLLALERAGLKPRLVTSTFTEILASFRADAPFACTPGVYRTPERETFARFIGPLYVPLPPVIVVRRADAGLAASARSLDSLLAGGLRVVLGDGYWYGDWLARALERTGTSPTRTREENAQMLRSIVNGAHDISFMSHEEAGHLLRTHPDLGASLTLRPVPGNPDGESRFLMLAKGVDAATAGRIDAALRELAETPRYRELVRSLRRE
ncbi:amino acid ABC transporter substrate-binding protein [Desulfovibrio oxamicus]|uniref:Amino acid ABC transporter substrate-binding protein n=1 Tax=Nitratidesulfovibrio oxamicus TaxID=32016 RepID=A0ABS0J6K5_9BACT|nr:transporter substrate-binding domain-containing protein [Nitratidesulfovibrio oxamicus]MBG3877767.1 amino acid ABC transporter substrate-binding protein [Nitratidesulfovibrio oxamicus]